MNDTRAAFVLRIAPSRIDRVDRALKDDQIFIGWARAAPLLDPGLSWKEFREALRGQYYAEDGDLRRTGNAAGHMWRFIREMKPGDLVVVPHGHSFYVARIEGAATHDPSLVTDDSAFRRKVKWLNDKRPIPRSFARAALQSRMKIQGTCAYATDLLEEIEECLRLSKQGKRPSFQSDLLGRLVKETLDEIRSGRMESFGFERLLASVLRAQGAEDVRIVPRNEDKGADLLATFLLAGTCRLLVAVQAKHYRPEPPVGADVVKQTIQGIEAEAADLGMIVTSGSFSNEAVAAADAYRDEKGIRIELVDGDLLATLIVERGLRAPGGNTVGIDPGIATAATRPRVRVRSRR